MVHPDHLNTPRQIYNDQQQLAWRWDQAEPFGSSPPNENPSGLGTCTFDLRFPGQVYDKETNLAYNYFRDFDPGLGRYVQSDPVGLAGGLNTYSYVANAPLGQSDPYGLEPISLRYGNWCGKNYSGGKAGPRIPANPAAPVDSLDECCMAHDYCYQNYELCVECGRKVVEVYKVRCDETLHECLDKLRGRPPQAWPRPPKPGTEHTAFQYCQWTKKWSKEY